MSLKIVNNKELCAGLVYSVTNKTVTDRSGMILVKNMIDWLIDWLIPGRFWKRYQIKNEKAFCMFMLVTTLISKLFSIRLYDIVILKNGAEL